MVKNPPCSAKGAGLIPGPEGSHMPQVQLSLWATVLKPACLESLSHNKRGHTLQLESSPYSLQLEKARAATKTECSQKGKINKEINFFFLKHIQKC